MSTDVTAILSGLEKGSLPIQSGLSAFLLKSREAPVEVLEALPYVLNHLETSQDFQTISTVLELLAELLGPCEDENVGITVAKTPFFYSTDPLLYPKFENVVILRSGNLYSLCSPGLSENYLFF